jgi:hypothetical protein
MYAAALGWVGQSGIVCEQSELSSPDSCVCMTSVEQLLLCGGRVRQPVTGAEAKRPSSSTATVVPLTFEQHMV